MKRLGKFDLGQTPEKHSEKSFEISHLFAEISVQQKGDAKKRACRQKDNYKKRSLRSVFRDSEGFADPNILGNEGFSEELRVNDVV